MASRPNPVSRAIVSPATIAMPRWMIVHSGGLSGMPAASSFSASPVSRSRFCTTRPASSTADRATWLWPSAPGGAVGRSSGREASEYRDSRLRTRPAVWFSLSLERNATARSANNPSANAPMATGRNHG